MLSLNREALAIAVAVKEVTVFLGARDIRRRLAAGTLGIDPFDERELSGFSIELRLGTQFRRSSLAERAASPGPPGLAGPQSKLLSKVELGEYFAIAPGASVVGISLEYVHFPADLAGFLFPRAFLEQLGLMVAAGTIDPGFQGKLAFVIRNASLAPIQLQAGQRIMRLCFAELSGPGDHGYPLPATIPEAEEIRDLKAALDQDALTRAAGVSFDPNLSKRLATALQASVETKGKLLEQLIADMFTSLDGLVIMKRNARLRAEEIDLVLKNNLTTGFWRLAGSPIIVECKNWSGKVGAREISVLVDKLQAVSPDAKTGILVAPNGITGDSLRDALLKIREARQRGRYILIFDRDDLQQIADGVSLGDIVERKYDETILI
jgi:dCTP deaminase